jgi:aspartate kinase
MRVFKFGGASIRDAAAIRNVGEIISRYHHEQLVIVISALGKTTNALEIVAESIFKKNAEVAVEKIQALEEGHLAILNELFTDKNHLVFAELKRGFERLYDLQRYYCLKNVTIDHGYDYLYDQIVSLGEIFSSMMVSYYLQSTGLNTFWLDVRTVIKTDHQYREGNVNWDVTEELAQHKIKPLLDNYIVCTQGFIGGTIDNHTTTLGREGSDYTAAIMAYCLDAEEVVIWKDVPGVLNADPRLYPDAKLLNKISYKEAVELAYYGATVIHPKTLKPLQNKNIKLRVKSFINPDKEGTEISVATEFDNQMPSFIFKTEQVLITLSAKDFSFINESHLSEIFRLLSDLNLKVGIMQNSAMNFAACIDDDKVKVPALVKELNKNYQVQAVDGLRLVTIRHYNQETIDRIIDGQEVLLSQENHTTARYVVKPG